MAGLIQGVNVFPSGIAIKFLKTVKVSSLVNSNFSLFANTATPVSVPFETINIDKDFNSINRVLALRYHHSLTQGITYRLRISGLIDAAGNAIATDYYDYTPASTIDVNVQDLESITPSPIEIIDKSEQSNAFLSTETIVASNPDFYIVDTDPENFDLYVDEQYNSGRITIKFSSAPDDGFVNSNYFKLQKKLIQRSPSPWRTVATHTSADSTHPWVYVDMPSTDATPVYAVAGKNYYEQGYKYRLKISKAVGT